VTALVSTFDTLRRAGAPAPRRLLALLGPGYVVAVGYMDPGNWATDIAAGAGHGFALLAAVLVASLVGIVLQALVIRLTLAAGRDLARLVRDRFPLPATILVWLASEIALVATDLAELLGSAVALQLLFGLPILAGILLAALLTLALLALPGAGGRAPELAIGLLVAVVALCFAGELTLARPPLPELLRGFVPHPAMLRDPDMLYLSLGILGATVMPHNLFLHSGLAVARLREPGAAEPRRLAAWLTRDSTVALALAFLVNCTILILAAIAYRGGTGSATPGIEGAYDILAAGLGSGAALVFAVALLAAGQSATATGTMAGQFVTQGFLGFTLAPWLRALVTRGAALVPALAVPLLAGDAAVDDLLVLTQVVLGLALPFILVPMLLLLRDGALMGRLRLSPVALRAAAALTLLLTGLNAWLGAAGIGVI
jgi:manganese transport protein